MNRIAHAPLALKPLQLALLSMLCIPMLSAHSEAATLRVTSLADSGSGSLRATIASAAVGDTIEITATGMLTLTSGAISITKTLNLVGPGSGTLTISGNNNSRIFNIVANNASNADAPVSISGVTLTQGKASGSCPSPASTAAGGAIVATESLNLTDVVLSNNRASRNGGAVTWALRRNGQTLTIANSQFISNSTGCSNANEQAQGGGLYIGYDSNLPSNAAGIVTISNSQFISNTAARSGGGIAIGAPVTANLSGSRIVGNSASNAYGGGVHIASPVQDGLTAATLLIQNSELTENTASLAGGAASHVNVGSGAQTSGTEAQFAFINSTVSGNRVTSSNGNAAAISVAGNTSLSIDSSTIAYNHLSAASSGAAITRSTCTLASGNTREAGSHSIDSSILALTNDGNSAFYDLSDGGASFSTTWLSNNNLIQRRSASLSGSNTVSGQDPQLLKLAFNGGSTRSHALVPGSAAIDAGSNTLNLSLDQRGTGFNRVVGTSADMGAFEYDEEKLTVAEYYHTELDSYFITGRPNEQHLLDQLSIFKRTGATFQSKAATSSNLDSSEQQVCRYYISLSEPYTSTHFYGFQNTDCNWLASLNLSGYNREGNDFVSYAPTSATTCPSAAPVPVYRSFRAAANGKTPNHRYSTSASEYAAMTANGWTPEGVAFCSSSAATPDQ